METIVWSEKFFVGVAQIDQQHEKLIALTNKLIEAMNRSDAHGMVYEVMVELIDYIAIHFDAEEHWMKTRKYPKLRDHKEMHYDLLKRVLMEQSNYWKAEEGFPDKMATFLVGWVTDHILKEDKKLKKYAKKELD